MTVWDQIDETGRKGPKKPFWALDFDNEEELLRWLNEEVAHLEEQAMERVQNQRKNLAVYRGIQYQSQDTRTRDEAAHDHSPKRSRNPRVIYNHMVDMVEQDVSRITKYRGAISCTPPSQDNDDRITAEVGEDLVEAFWDKTDIDALMTKHRRRTRLFGEDYIAALWNKNLGPYDPDWLAAVFQQAGIKKDPRKISKAEIRQIMRKEIKEIPRVPIVGEDGELVRGDDGEPLYIERPVRRGDIDHRIIFSWDMLMQRKATYEESDYGTFRERLMVDTVRAMHPKKADKIAPDGSGTYFDIESLEEQDLPENECYVRHFYHRSTDLLDQGRYIKFTRTAILINKPNPYVGWDDRAILPWTRTPDIDAPGVLNGDATVTHGRGPMAVYNNLISLKVRNRFQFSHPKWFFPQNSVTKESLTNNSTLVSFKGPTPPVLSQPAINEANETQQLQEAKTDLQQIMGVYGVSRGEPPTGVTAAVALTFLDEQENERANVGVQNHTRTLKQLALMDLWLMADHYDEDRIAELLGKTRADQAKTFKMADLRSIADLKIQNAPALPQQKSARIQYILDIKKEWPGIIADDTAVDLLGLGEVDRLRSIITVAIRKAEEENNGFLNGAKVEAPMDQEYHLAHYRAHMRQMNEPSYVRLPRGSQTAMQGHVRAHEMFLYQQALKNPEFQMLIMREFPGFPVFFKPEEMGAAPLPPLPAPGAMPGEAPIPGQLPPPMDPGVPPGADLTTPEIAPEAPGAEVLTPAAGV